VVYGNDFSVLAMNSSMMKYLYSLYVQSGEIFFQLQAGALNSMQGVQQTIEENFMLIILLFRLNLYSSFLGGNIRVLSEKDAGFEMLGGPDSFFEMPDGSFSMASSVRINLDGIPVSKVFSRKLSSLYKLFVRHSSLGLSFSHCYLFFWLRSNDRKLNRQTVDLLNSLTNEWNEGFDMFNGYVMKIETIVCIVDDPDQYVFPATFSCCSQHRISKVKGNGNLSIEDIRNFGLITSDDDEVSIVDIEMYTE
jgi:hypothetical protein